MLLNGGFGFKPLSVARALRVFVSNLLTATVTRTGTRTVSSYATGAVIADGETDVVIPEDVQALAGYRLATTTDDGAMLGGEENSDVNFDTPSAWTLIGESTVENGEAYILSTTGANSGVTSKNEVKPSLGLLEITGVVSEYTSGECGFAVAGGTEPRVQIPSAAGPFSVQYLNSRDGDQLFNVQRMFVFCDMKISQLSVKPVFPTWKTTDVDGVQLPDLRGLSVGISGQNSATDDDVWEEPTPSVVTDSWAIDLFVNPDDTGQTTSVFGSYVDADNYTEVLATATTLILRKRVGGVNFDATFTYTHVDGTLFECQIFGDTVNGTGIRAADGAIVAESFNTNANTTAAQFGTTVSRGSLNGASFFEATYRASNFYASKEAAGW